MDRWLLEHDSKGEIYTLPSTECPAIERVLNLFDGSATFYCCLSDTTDDSCLWCVGEPNRRIIEGRLIDGQTIRHFVLRRKGDGDGAVTVRYGTEPAEVVTVSSPEVLTATEAMVVFHAFHRDKTIPGEYEPVPKVCLFGSHSFGG